MEVEYFLADRSRNPSLSAAQQRLAHRGVCRRHSPTRLQSTICHRQLLEASCSRKSSTRFLKPPKDAGAGRIDAFQVIDWVVSKTLAPT